MWLKRCKSIYTCAWKYITKHMLGKARSENMVQLFISQHYDPVYTFSNIHNVPLSWQTWHGNIHFCDKPNSSFFLCILAKLPDVMEINLKMQLSMLPHILLMHNIQLSASPLSKTYTSVKPLLQKLQLLKADHIDEIIGIEPCLCLKISLYTH